MRIGIATVQVPFVRGGAEMLAESLAGQVRAHGHEAEIISVPFKWYPAHRIPEHMLACRLLDLEESNGMPIDRLIGLKFPAYLIRHPQKVLWLLHQHRGAYDLWGSPLGDLTGAPDGAHVRHAIHEADRRAIAEAAPVYTISRNVSQRLQAGCGLPSTPLYHPPPHAERFGPGEYGDYVLLPSRINAAKRQALVVDALARTRQPVRIVLMGAGDDPGYEAELRRSVDAHDLGSRVHWTGRVSDEERFRLYRDCLGVVFPAFDEDYGYVTLEAMLSAKPVVTCTDSGGPLEFVQDGVTGLACQPAAAPLAAALDTLWADRALARTLGQAGRAQYRALGIGWDSVLSCLLA